MCSSIGVIAMTDPVDAYSRMLHEALIHLGERLDQLGADVQRIDSTVTALTANLEKMPRSDVLQIEKGQRVVSATSPPRQSWSKRLMALERGQRTLAAGTRRALRQALAAHRAVKEPRLSLSSGPVPLDQDSNVHAQPMHSETWEEFPHWLDSFLQREFNQLDGQVSKLTASVHKGSFQDSCGGVPVANSSCPSSLQSFRPFRFKDEEKAMSIHAPEEVFAQKSRRASGPLPTLDRDPTLVELMEEAVEEAEMEQLHKAAREEAERLRKELVRVQKFSCTKTKR